ncbi:hypothetical protein RCL1_005664 [Eukaryota sp. TZLM3-RCL]
MKNVAITLLLITLFFSVSLASGYKRVLFYSNHGCGLKKWPAAQVFKEEHMHLYPDMSSFPNTVDPRFEFFIDDKRYKTLYVEETTSLQTILSWLEKEGIYKHFDDRYEPLIL